MACRPCRLISRCRGDPSRRVTNRRPTKYNPANDATLHAVWSTEKILMSDAGQMFSDGKTYERMMGRWSKLAGRIFLDWLEAPNDLHWIEVGCGNGAFTEEL